MTIYTDVQLHVWAEGSNPLAAAVELLIRGGLAYGGAPESELVTGGTPARSISTASATKLERFAEASSALRASRHDSRRAPRSTCARTSPGLGLAYSRWVMTAVAQAAGFTEAVSTIEDKYRRLSFAH